MSSVEAQIQLKRSVIGQMQINFALDHMKQKEFEAGGGVSVYDGATHLYKNDMQFRICNCCGDYKDVCHIDRMNELYAGVSRKEIIFSGPDNVAFLATFPSILCRCD